MLFIDMQKKKKFFQHEFSVWIQENAQGNLILVRIS